MADKTYFKKRSDLTSGALIFMHLTAALAPLYLSVILPWGAQVILCWLVLGLSMNGIVNLLHECTHGLTFRSKSVSEFLGRFIVGPLVFIDYDKYRERHWAHHKFLGEEGETKDSYLINISGKNIFIHFLSCLLLAEAVKKISKQIDEDVKDEGWLPPFWRGQRLQNIALLYRERWLVKIFFFQVLFFGLLVLMSHAFTGKNWQEAVLTSFSAYFLVYVYGLLSLTIFMVNLRAIAEHQMLDKNSAHRGYASLRNFKCTFLSRYLMGAYGFGEHYTHHLVPGIPYYALPAVTLEMAKNNPALIPQKDYFKILSEIIHSQDQPK